MADPDAGDTRPLVVVVGSINIDHVVRVDAFPLPGATIMGHDVAVGLGGKGANQAVAAARAGARVALVARVGDDEAGRTATWLLAEDEVDVGGVAPVAGAATGSAWITVTPADNTIVVVAGANARWDGARCDGARWDGAQGLPAGLLSAAAVVVAQLEVPLAVVAAAVRQATGLLVLNAAPARPLPDDLVRRCDVLVVNEHELAVVAESGAATTVTPEGVVALHAELRARGAGAVVTTLGARGAVTTDATGTTTTPSPSSVVVDTTGAGDAFTGVLAARLAAGDDLRAAVRWGVAAGSLTVRRGGAHDAFPTRAALEGLLASTDDAATLSAAARPAPRR